jgi:hypothetical protein
VLEAISGGGMTPVDTSKKGGQASTGIIYTKIVQFGLKVD